MFDSMESDRNAARWRALCELWRTRVDGEDFSVWFDRLGSDYGCTLEEAVDKALEILARGRHKISVHRPYTLSR